MSKYLDENGLLYFWGKVKSFVTTRGYTTNEGTITEVQTVAGAYSAIDVTSGKATVNIPNATSHLTNDSGYITSADIPEGAAASSTSPLMDGTAAVGSETTFARGDHRHPTDTTRAPLASPTFTGTPAAPTASAGTNTTQIATTEFVTSAISTAIGGITGISYSVVTSLPATGQAGVIYLVSNGGSNPNSYDEYIWLTNAYEKIGTTDVDLSNYLQISATITNGEIDTIVAS